MEMIILLNRITAILDETSTQGQGIISFKGTGILNDSHKSVQTSYTCKINQHSIECNS